MMGSVVRLLGWLFGLVLGAHAQPPSTLSGIYPSLAVFNSERECGIGAVVPWAGRLWVITYGPHLPYGSSDRLYEITPDLVARIRPESVGGTHANRLIHPESRQLFIGPYAIGADGTVRVIPPARMPGRLTGTARHLTHPADRVYFATMEEGLYEVDVHTLAVTAHIRDGNTPGPNVQVDRFPSAIASTLPGYHGKGLYSGQGRLIYANNGERGDEALTDPTTPSGALAEWRSPGSDWQLVRRNQFTEVTGPGGIHGNPNPATDPVWSIGWDARSLILMVLDEGRWHAFRLPKASHSYDGAHGWNTEWPRIRDIGEEDLLMTMHGMFWRFPRTFGPGRAAGLAPRSTYLKVVGDFARWQDRIVLGCDDTARSEFLNTRRAKGSIRAPQSQSNLWFLEPAQLDRLGPVIGRGALWRADDVARNTRSDPFLAAFARRGLHLAHRGSEPLTVRIEADAAGAGRWEVVREVALPAAGYVWMDLAHTPPASWIRAVPLADARGLTVEFHGASPDGRTSTADPIFDALAPAGAGRLTGGVVRALDGGTGRLGFAAAASDGTASQILGYYELGPDLALRRIEGDGRYTAMIADAAVPAGIAEADAASALIVDDRGRRWRLPLGDAAFGADGPLGPARVAREVATERDLLNLHGTFYELPAENAGGFAKLRPVATHNRRILDFCSFRGLLVMSGVAADAPAGNPHLIRSDDGRTALWVGAIDDLWRFGKPRGTGGPWRDHAVEPGVPSDPYLFTGYDRRSVTVSQTGAPRAALTLEVDLDGSGSWVPYRTFRLADGATETHAFPDAFQAYWIRAVSDAACHASVQLHYD
jgi:hypothetical protein